MEILWLDLEILKVITKRKKDKGSKSQKKAIALNEVLGQPVSIKKFEVSSFAEIPLKDFHNRGTYVKTLKVHGINHTRVLRR